MQQDANTEHHALKKRLQLIGPKACHSCFGAQSDRTQRQRAQRKTLKAVSRCPRVHSSISCAICMRTRMRMRTRAYVRRCKMLRHTRQESARCKMLRHTTRQESACAWMRSTSAIAATPLRLRSRRRGRSARWCRPRWSGRRARSRPTGWRRGAATSRAGCFLTILRNGALGGGGGGTGTGRERE
eukprot:6213472-Pleurochrysis_carterae.AAC.6